MTADPELLAKLIENFKQSLKENKLDTYKPYGWQKEFHDAGKLHRELMIMAGNRTGKTLCAAIETTFHLTGEYPDWWDGRRFDHPILAWTGSPTNETSKDIVQTELLGGVGEDFGTGWIPKSRLIGKPTTRQAGVKNVVDTFQVRHISGGISNVTLKTYEQGWKKWQGTKPHWVWLDEEPDDYMIYSEAQTRVVTTQGSIIVTFTPLSGLTELVQHFQEGGRGIYMRNATWDDAPHIPQEDKDRMYASYRPHEREARTKGVPMMGEGAVYPVADEDIAFDLYEQFPNGIPAYFARIKGCDFGMDHPAAGCEIAWDRDQDIIYLIDCYRQANALAPYHASWLKKGNPLIPVAWPHDGVNREKTGGKTLAQAYRQHGANMMSKSARYPKVRGETEDKGGAQAVEPIVEEILQRMVTGRFKAARHLKDFFEEKRSYHRKDGRIVDRRDDILKAVSYAIMMKRYAVTPGAMRMRQSSAPQAAHSSVRL
mgnify:CR=1 FL=1